jgi:HEAT repeat protein
MAALAHLPLVGLASATPEPLAERVHLAMSLLGDPKYLPVLIDLAAGSVSEPSKASREAAFAALAEAELGSFAARLHRLAGDPDREVRLGAAAALVPSGEAWTLRLLLGNLDPSSPRERASARGAVRRLPRERAQELLGEMVEDGTARSFGVVLYLELAEESEVRRSRPLQEKLWRVVADDARAGDRAAILAASGLSHAGAIAVVTGRLSAP